MKNTLESRYVVVNAFEVFEAEGLTREGLTLYDYARFLEFGSSLVIYLGLMRKSSGLTVTGKRA